LIIRLTSWLKPLIASRPWENRYAQGAAKLAGSVLLAQIIAFIGGLILARYLYPPATQDLVASFLWLINTLTPLATLRYDVGIIMPKSDRAASQVFRLSIVTTLLMPCMSIPVILLCGQLGYGQWASLLWIPPTIFAQGLTNTFIGWCNRMHFFGMQSTTKIILAALYPAFAALACLIWGAHSANLPAAYSLATIAGAAIFAAALGRTGTFPKLALRWPNWRALSKTAYRYRQLPLLSVPGYTLNMASVAVLVASLQSFTPGTSASFNLVFQILRVPAVLIGMAVGQVFTAKAATLVSDASALRRLTLRSMAALTMLAIPFALTFSWFGPYIFGLVYGDAWREAGDFSRWLAWGAATGLVTTPLAMIPTLLHSNRIGLVISALIAIARCSVGWLATQGVSPWTVVIGCTLVDIGAAVVFVLFVFWLLYRQAKQTPKKVSINKSAHRLDNRANMLH
jgi:O-antigen/teichoic acid export membrane protein